MTSAAAAGLLAGAGGGLLSPDLLRRLPAKDPELRAAYRALTADRPTRVALVITTAVACGLLGLRLGWSAQLPVWLYLGAVGVLLAVIDWRIRRLPAALVNPSQVIVALGLVSAAAVTSSWGALIRAGEGWAAAGGLFAVGWLAQPRSLGYGDVRLAALLGMALGWQSWQHLPAALLTALMLAAADGGLSLVTRRLDPDRQIPFCPFLIGGAVLAVLLVPAAH